MGVCKHGCADVWVEFFLGRYSMGVCKRLKSEVARIYVASFLLLFYGGSQARLRRRLGVKFSWLVVLWGFASGRKVRSRECTSPLSCRCAMGVWKGGCADEFFLGRYSMRVCKRSESEVAQIYVATCCSLCYMGVCKRGCGDAWVELFLARK